MTTMQRRSARDHLLSIHLLQNVYLYQPDRARGNVQTERQAKL
jgi:hypothetical protein